MNQFKSHSLLFVFGITLLMSACTSRPSSTTDADSFYTVADYRTVPKTDVHVHVFTESNDFVDIARDNNFRLVNVALDPRNKASIVRKQMDYCEIQKKNNPSVIETITSFSMEGWDEPGWLQNNLAWLDSCFNRGAIGVKIWKNIGMSFRDKNGKLIMIDDPGFDPIFRMLTEKKIPVLGHLGEPKNCWLPIEEMTTNNDRSYFTEHPQYHMYQHPDFPTYEEQIAARDKVLEKNPNLTFVGAHMGSLEWSVDELAKRLDKFPNMSIDLAARMGQVFYQTIHEREKVREFFIKYQDRILYATDLSADGEESKEALKQSLEGAWMRDWQYFVTDDTLTSPLVNESYQGIKLPREVVDKIYFKNAQRWLGVFKDEASTASLHGK
jgi:predicted TIM-barrel fold metal-dependent hydrolase